jgi:hypothetical protein
VGYVEQIKKKKKEHAVFHQLPNLEVYWALGSQWVPSFVALTPLE